MQGTRALSVGMLPLSNRNEVNVTSPPMHEPAPNRQPTDLDFNNPHQSRYPTSSMPDSNYYQQYPQAQTLPNPAFLSNLRQTQSWAQPARPKPRYSAEDDAVEHEWTRLYSRVLECEAFRKYREHQESKIDKKDGDQVWPEHLEQAFFRAIIRHPPMGRGKQLHKDRQHGRNELISDCLKELTGERRDRKQVSSHIQVLKPFFEHDSLIMKYFPTKEPSSHHSKSRHLSSTPASGRKLSNYPVSTRTPYLLQHSTHYNSDPFESRKSDLNLFRPADFQMFVQRKCLGPNGLEQIERLHTYTHTVNDPYAPEIRLADWHRLATDYPLLADLHAQTKLDCNVVVGEASLAIPAHTWESSSQTTNDVEVGISFLCTSSYLNEPDARIRCRNNFYRNGQYIDMMEYDGQSDHYLHRPDPQGASETWINFGSRFWASTLATVSQQLREPATTLHDPIKVAKAQVREIRVVQEIFSMANPSLPDRLLVIHWAFRLTSGSIGQVCFKKLVLPSKLSSALPIVPRVDSAYGHNAESISGPRLPEQQVAPVLFPPFEFERSSGSVLSSDPWPSALSRHSSGPDYGSDGTLGYAGSNSSTYDSGLRFNGLEGNPLAFQPSPGRYSSGHSSVPIYSQPWYPSEGYSHGFEEQASAGHQDDYKTSAHGTSESRTYLDIGDSGGGGRAYPQP